MLRPDWYFPSNVATAHYAPPWANWFLDPGNPRAQEPPRATRRQMELYRQLAATLDRRRQIALMRDVLDIAAEEFYAVGISLVPSGYGIAKNRVRNIPATILGSWLYPNPSPTNPPQYFIEQ